MNKNIINDIAKYLKIKYNKHIAVYHSGECSWFNIDNKIILFKPKNYVGYPKADMEFMKDNINQEDVIAAIYENYIFKKKVKKYDVSI